MFLNRKLGTVAALWGSLGTIALLAYAITRMGDHAAEAINQPWSVKHFGVLAPWVAFMAYAEGYRGFQRAFSPRVASRAVYLRDHSTLLRLLFAPLFCMAFFDAPVRRRVSVVILVILITSIVVLFQFIPQPWRGILDMGVVVGLSWGIAATLFYLFRFWASENVPFDAEVIEAGNPKRPDGSHGSKDV